MRLTRSVGPRNRPSGPILGRKPRNLHEFAAGCPAGVRPYLSVAHDHGCRECSRRAHPVHTRTRCSTSNVGGGALLERKCDPGTKGRPSCQGRGGRESCGSWRADAKRGCGTVSLASLPFPYSDLTGVIGLSAYPQKGEFAIPKGRFSRRPDACVLSPTPALNPGMSSETECVQPRDESRAAKASVSVAPASGAGSS
jgi:hypothetical protein